MSIKRRSFSKEFKLRVVRQVRSGKRQVELAREYQILPKTISRWLSEYDTYQDGAFTGEGRPHTPAARTAALERDNTRLRAENELLKKALRCLDGIPSPAEGNGDSA